MQNKSAKPCKIYVCCQNNIAGSTAKLDKTHRYGDVFELALVLEATTNSSPSLSLTKAHRIIRR